MSVALAARTVVALAFLSALFLNGRAETRTGMIAVALLAVWAIPLLRERALTGRRSTRA